jgi:hypothetical protein
MKSLLITLVNEKGKPKSHEDEKTQKPIKKNKEEKKEKPSYFLVKNRKKYTKAKNDLMNYLIDEQSKYTNLDKAAEYYQNQIEEFKRQIDRNQNIIDKKQNILNSMNNQFSDLLIKNMICYDDGKIKQKENEKNQIENEIETLTQALEMYKNIKTELQIENINLKKDLKSEYFESLSRKNQYDKYAVIKTKIENEEKAQDKLFHTMSNFETKAKLMFEDKENKKKNILAREEFSLNELKQSMQDAEEHLKKLYKKIQKKEKLLPFEKKKNEKIFQDNILLRKECASNYLKVNLIKKYYKLKNLDELVILMKKRNMEFNQKYNNLNNMLNDLTNLNIENTRNIKEIKSIRKEIKNKLESKGLIYDEPELINKIVLINGSKEENILVKEKTDKKENILKDIIRFIDLYYPQFDKMIKSILTFNLKIKEKSISKTNLEKIFKLFNNKENLQEIKKYCSTKEYSKEDYKGFIKIILQFFRKFNYLYHNFIIDIAIEASKNNKKNDDDSDEENKMTIFVFTNISKEIEEEEKEKKLQKKEKMIRHGKKMDDNQIKNQLIKDNITKEISNMLDQGIDIEKLLINYINILRQRNEEKNYVPDNKNRFDYETIKEKRKNERKRKRFNEENERINEIQSLIYRLRMKFFFDFSKYTSDLVKHDDWEKKNKYKYNVEIRISNKKKNVKNLLGDYLGEYKRTKIAKNYNKGFTNVMDNIIQIKKEEKEEERLKKIEKKEDEENQVLDNTFSDENEYNKHPDIEVEKKVVKQNKYYFGYNNNNDKAEKEYKKMLNLHKINMELFHKKATLENFQDFDELQNEFQKKLNMKIYSPIVDFFLPKRDYSNTKYNYLKTATNFHKRNKSNDGLGKINSFSNNKNRIVSSKNINKNKKKGEIFPKIISGNVFIAN